ncbi:hypothetical protein GCM10022226_65510 [Sphaerisporangium flaviroseum]|uniref:Uncharacterized protein n=1 Tax=Sphaerisporangium flaviroseum TaxID=509199 RepID=A0ABP7J532_9ACTN
MDRYDAPAFHGEQREQRAGFTAYRSPYELRTIAFDREPSRKPDNHLRVRAGGSLA